MPSKKHGEDETNPELKERGVRLSRGWEKYKEYQSK